MLKWLFLLRLSPICDVEFFWQNFCLVRTACVLIWCSECPDGRRSLPVTKGTDKEGFVLEFKTLEFRCMYLLSLISNLPSKDTFVFGMGSSVELSRLQTLRKEVNGVGFKEQ